jgi:hypothetical protein
MFERYVTFKFELDKKAMKHLEDKSSYNHNYYELNLHVYGDYILPEKCNILYEEASDDDFDAYYSLGYFEGDKFQPMFTWLDKCQQLDVVI